MYLIVYRIFSSVIPRNEESVSELTLSEQYLLRQLVDQDNRNIMTNRIFTSANSHRYGLVTTVGVLNPIKADTGPVIKA